MERSDGKKASGRITTNTIHTVFRAAEGGRVRLSRAAKREIGRLSRQSQKMRRRA